MIDISKGIKIGGFDYAIDMSQSAHKSLQANNDNGQCDCHNCVITLDSDCSPEQISKVFIHEIIEAVNHVYCNDKIEHEKIQQLSFGIHQVMESLGVRFGNEGISSRS